jgi:hypothetical protein
MHLLLIFYLVYLFVSPLKRITLLSQYALYKYIYTTQSVSPALYVQLQKGGKDMFKRFTYTSPPIEDDAFYNIINLLARKVNKLVYIK